MKILLLLMVACESYYHDKNPDGCTIPITSHYKIQPPEHFLDKLLKIKKNKCYNKIINIMDTIFENIKEEEYNDSIFVNIFKKIIVDVKDNSIDLSSSLKLNISIEKKYVDIFLKIYPNEKFKIENYIKNIKSYLNIEDSCIIIKDNYYHFLDIYKPDDKFERYLENIIKNKDITLKLYEIYINRIDRKDFNDLKETLNLLIKSIVYNDYKRKFGKDLIHLFENTEVYIKDGKLDFLYKPYHDIDKVLSSWKRDSHMTMQDLSKEYGLSFKYENSILYIEAIPVSLEKYNIFEGEK